MIVTPLAAVSSFAASQPLVAQATAANSYAWGIVLFCIAMGLLVTLRPPHRTTEVKRKKPQ